MLRYALELVPKILFGILIFFIFVLIVSKATEPDKPIKEPHWTNLDLSKDPQDVLKYNYNEGTVEYRKYGPPPKSKIKLVHGKKTDPENLIYDNNIDIEDLMDYAHSY